MGIFKALGFGLRTYLMSFVSRPKAIFHKEKHSSDSPMLWHRVVLQSVFPCKISSFWHRQKNIRQVLTIVILKLLMPGVVSGFEGTLTAFFGVTETVFSHLQYSLSHEFFFIITRYFGGLFFVLRFGEVTYIKEVF
jgi:hypothetical protein